MAFIAFLAIFGIIMPPTPAFIVAGVLLSAAAFAFFLDQVKVALFRHLRIV